MNCVALLLMACLASECVSATRLKRDGFDLEEDSSQETKVGDLGDLGSLIVIVKEQFRSIIEESVKQIVDYVKAALQNFKIKMLKKLGRWTFSDLFHTVFDGVTDFVIEADADAEPSEEEPIASAVNVRPAQPRPGNPNYAYYPYSWRG